MPRDDHIEIEGTVQEALGGGQYSVTVPGDEKEIQIRARLSGRLKKFRIRVIPGDIVTVHVSPYDMTHGFITYRGPKRKAPQT